MIEMLPSGAKWKATRVEVNGYETEAPLTFFWRNAKDCLQQIYGNPILADAMEHWPYRIFDSPEKRVRYFAGPMSADWSWHVQVCALSSHSLIFVTLTLFRAKRLKLGEERRCLRLF